MDRKNWNYNYLCAEVWILFRLHFLFFKYYLFPLVFSFFYHVCFSYLAFGYIWFLLFKARVKRSNKFRTTCCSITTELTDVWNATGKRRRRVLSLATASAHWVAVVVVVAVVVDVVTININCLCLPKCLRRQQQQVYACVCLRACVRVCVCLCSGCCARMLIVLRGLCRSRQSPL